MCMDMYMQSAHTNTHTVKLSLSIVAWGHIVCRETIDSTEADDTDAYIETSYFLQSRGTTSYEALCRRVSKRNLNENIKIFSSFISPITQLYVPLRLVNIEGH